MPGQSTVRLSDRSGSRIGTLPVRRMVPLAAMTGVALLNALPVWISVLLIGKYKYAFVGVLVAVLPAASTVSSGGSK